MTEPNRDEFHDQAIEVYENLWAKCAELSNEQIVEDIQLIASALRKVATASAEGAG